MQKWPKTAMVTNKHLSLSLLSFFVLVVTACIHQTVFTPREIEEKFSIAIPEYLAPSEKLNAEAACQFQSLDEEIYLVIAYENKEFIESFDLQPSLSDYHNRVVQQGFLEEINDALIDTTIIDTLGQYKQLITTVRGTINTYPIVYELRIIETGTAYYQVVLWARKDKFSKHQQDIKRMLASFKEL